MDARRVAVTMGLVLGLLGGASATMAQEATPGVGPEGPPPLPEGCEVIAEGLLNPRFVTVATDGSIYVSEAGVGGDEAVAPPSEPGATPAAGAEEGEFTGTRGDSGQVTMIAPDGSQSVIATGLASYAAGPDVAGPSGIYATDDGQIILAVGGAGPATAFTEPLPNENSVLSIDPATGEATRLADIDAYERANNPDPNNIDSNLYGLSVGNDGTIYVNDAGGNTTYTVPAGGGEPEVLVVHPGLPLPEGMEAPPGGNPGRGGANELDPVPTGIELADDGSVLVGLLSGGPFPPGAAKIVTVGVDGTLSDVAGGLTMVVSIAAAPDGQLYASQISTNFLGEMPEPGSVVRVFGDGTQEVVADGLMLPNGITFDNDGNLLIVTNSVAMGEPNGQVLRCAGVGAAAAGGSEEVGVAMRDAFFRS